MDEIYEKTMRAKPSDLAKLISECTDFADYDYIPSDFKNPLEFEFPYENSFGRAGWEMIAANIIGRSQDEGAWVYIKNLNEDFDQIGMIKAGFLVETEEGYMLTPRALEKIAEKYLK